MTVKIIFEAHSTTYDNEEHLSSGWFDVDLSELGIQQAKELGHRYENDYIETIFCSDLKRSYRTAEIAFSNKYPIIKDFRLRECNYGSFTKMSSEIVDEEKIRRIQTPFPDGESYMQTTERMRDFLISLLKKYNGKMIMIIGHRATQYGLEYWINKQQFTTIISNPWKWQPGWLYFLEKI